MRRVAHYTATVVAFILFGIGGALLSWFVMPWVWLFAPGREQAIARCQHTLQAGFRLFLGGLRSLNLLKTQWPLAEHITPSEPCVLICNHPCLLDTVIMTARYDNVVCLVKQSYYDNPLFFGLAKLCGYIPAGRPGEIEGHQRMVDEAVDRIRRGYSVLAFPETRRTPAGDRIPFRRAPFEIAARAGVPLVPVQISCTTGFLTREVPIHQMPLGCAQYSARELPPQRVEQGRRHTRAATHAIQNLLQPLAPQPGVAPVSAALANQQ